MHRDAGAWSGDCRRVRFEFDEVVADLDAIADREAASPLNARAVDPDPVVAVEIFNGDGAVGSQDSGMFARDIALGEADGIALLAPDGDLVANHANFGGFAFVVLDE